MADEAEESFTFRDRRRVNLDEPASAEAAPAPAASSSASPSPIFTGDPGFGPEDEQELPDIYSVLMLFLGELRNLAWLRMGLVANPGTGRIEKDMEQAKIAIDTVGFLATQIEPVLAPEERLPLKAMISDLQINFVAQSKRP